MNSKRRLIFGKVDWNGRGRANNLVTVDVRLSDNKDGFPTFAVSADVWNAKQTDILAGGQMLAEIKRVPENNALFQEIKVLWKKYHLNDMHAGTIAQEEALKRSGLRAGQYAEAVEYLKKKGLYEVNLTPTEKKYNPSYAGKPYRYGHGWLYRPIPAKDLAKIRKIVGGK